MQTNQCQLGHLCSSTEWNGAPTCWWSAWSIRKQWNFHSSVPTACAYRCSKLCRLKPSHVGNVPKSSSRGSIQPRTNARTHSNDQVCCFSWPEPSRILSWPLRWVMATHLKAVGMHVWTQRLCLYLARCFLHIWLLFLSTDSAVPLM